MKRINADIPKGLDWKAGALRYVEAEIEKHGRETYLRYLLSKPFSLVPKGGTDGGASLIENVAYLSNFANTAAVLNLPGGARILDVACGSGWVAQLYARMGYEVFGFDISDDMVLLSRRRFAEDAVLARENIPLDERFFSLDIETSPLPEHLLGTFDAIVLECCTHHFHDPIAAMEHLVSGLKDDGLVMVIEGEARYGHLRDEYISVMKEFATLERPYAREQFEKILDLAGLPNREFLGRLPGWISPRDPRTNHLPDLVRGDSEAINFAVCAKKKSR